MFFETIFHHRMWFLFLLPHCNVAMVVGARRWSHIQLVTVKLWRRFGGQPFLDGLRLSFWQSPYSLMLDKNKMIDFSVCTLMGSAPAVLAMGPSLRSATLKAKVACRACNPTTIVLQCPIEPSQPDLRTRVLKRREGS